jgi:hypothetical protein
MKRNKLAFAAILTLCVFLAGCSLLSVLYTDTSSAGFISDTVSLSDTTAGKQAKPFGLLTLGRGIRFILSFRTAKTC